jgi:hypothetical protein
VLPDIPYDHRTQRPYQQLKSLVISNDSRTRITDNVGGSPPYGEMILPTQPNILRTALFQQIAEYKLAVDQTR